MQQASTTDDVSAHHQGAKHISSSSSSSPLGDIHAWFQQFLAQLPPTKDEKDVMRSVTKEVQEALRLNGERHKWTVAAVRKAGSFAKGTSLRCRCDVAAGA
jgi:hypothetical protein